jgi:hypothetical protein
LRASVRRTATAIKKRKAKVASARRDETTAPWSSTSDDHSVDVARNAADASSLPPKHAHCEREKKKERVSVKRNFSLLFSALSL